VIAAIGRERTRDDSYKWARWRIRRPRCSWRRSTGLAGCSSAGPRRLLAAWDWWGRVRINLPAGVFGTLWAYLRLRTPASGTGAGSTGLATSRSPSALARSWSAAPTESSRTTAARWAGEPGGAGELIGGAFLLAVFVIIETRVAEPMSGSRCQDPGFHLRELAGLLVSIARGGIQFMLIIWLQGIWLPLHGYSYDATPLWAGIFLLPMTAGFLVSGPTSGILSDKFGSRGIATAGMAVFALSFVG